MTTEEDQILIDLYEDIKDDQEFAIIMKEVVKLGKIMIDKLGTDYLLFLKYEELICHAEGIKLKKALGFMNIDSKVNTDNM